MIACGVDMVSIARMTRLMTRYGARLTRRLLTEQEASEVTLTPERLAVRFAAKEAVAKALGTGLWGRFGVRFHDIVIVKRDGGAPYVQLAGAAKRLFTACGGRRIALSLSHDGDVAVAMVVLEGVDV